MSVNLSSRSWFASWGRVKKVHTVQQLGEPRAGLQSFKGTEILIPVGNRTTISLSPVVQPVSYGGQSRFLFLCCGFCLRNLKQTDLGPKLF